MPRGTHKKDPSEGLRYGDRIEPGEVREQVAGTCDLGDTDQQSETASTFRLGIVRWFGRPGSSDQAGGNREDLIETFDGAKSNDVGGRAGEVFGTAVEDPGVLEGEHADDFAEECGLALARLDQRQRDLRRPDLDGQAGEAGAGADVEQTDAAGNGGVSREKVRGGEQGFANMSCHDIFRIARGGEIHAGVPAEQEVEVGGDPLHLERGDSRRLTGPGDERREQGGEVHRDSFEVQVSSCKRKGTVGAQRAGNPRRKARGRAITGAALIEEADQFTWNATRKKSFYFALPAD